MSVIAKFGGKWQNYNYNLVENGLFKKKIWWRNRKVVYLPKIKRLWQRI